MRLLDCPETNLALLATVDPDEEPGQDGRRKQIVVELTMDDWKELIDLFDIKATVIPSRKSNTQP